jgi:hypothetical protein
MSTPEQPASPALTRKQLRDIRNTGATPIVTEDDVPEVAPVAEVAPHAVEEAPEDAPAPEHTPQPSPQAVAAPLPRAAAPAVVHDLPGADASVDLGVSPLTRRQARQQERIRTASVPVITPEVAAAHAASVAAASTVDAEPRTDEPHPSGGVDLAQLFGTESSDSVAAEERADEPQEVVEAIIVPEDDARADEADTHADSSSEAASDELEPSADAADATPHEAAPDDLSEQRDDATPEDADAEREEPDRAIVNPQFGAELLAGDVEQVKLPASFDQLITRSVTGAIGTGNALILSQTPSAPPLGAPVASTGEVLITGSYNLPEGLGSTGHAAGTADGKETDAVLIDGELPAHSSPTPIAASAAISTVKNGGDIIKPPAPEKGGRLMLTLAITAGVLALALVGVLILAFVTGVF